MLLLLYTWYIKDILLLSLFICSDCETFFGGKYETYIRRDDSVICTTEYSKVVPLEGGEVRSLKNIDYMQLFGQCTFAFTDQTVISSQYCLVK